MLPVQVLDADSAEWVRTLTAVGADHTAAIVRLHAVVLRVARSEVRRRSAQLNITGPELDDLAHQAAADALMAVTAKLAEFRGESRFTTWVFRFVMLEVSAKFGRHFWRHPPVALDAEDWDRLPDRFGLDAAAESESLDLVAALRAAVEIELTPRQRRIFVAVVLQEIPLETLALELGSNRNAIYKTMFDARRKLRAALAANGYLDVDDAQV